MTHPLNRTHDWLDPAQLVEAARPLSGMEYLQAWADGELIPPMAATLGFRLHEFGEGHVDIRCTPEGYHYNPYGTVHGGLAATLLDSASGCAVQSRLPAGTGYATLDLNVSYLRPITTATGELRCIGRVTSLGRTVAFAHAEVLDPADRTLATASATCLIVGATST